MPPPPQDEPRVPRAREGAWRGYVVAAASVAVATLLMFGLYEVLGFERGSVPFIFFFGAVMLSARQGTGPGLLAIALSAVVADYYFLPPFGALSLGASALLQVSVFVVVSLLILQLTRRGSRAESEAQTARESLAATLMSIGDAVIATDAAGRITFMNTVAERLTGWAEGEARGRELPEVFRIVNELTREAVESPVARVLREGEVVGLANHTVLISKGGAETPIDDSGAPIKDRDGRTTGIVLVFHDITERRRSEAELRQRERELTDFVENATVGLHWVAPDGTILWANRAELEMLGYTAEEYIGHNVAEFHVEREAIDDILRRLSCGDELHNYEARLRHKDGSTRDVLISSNVLWDEAGGFVHTRCFTRDVTDRRRAEAAAARLAAIVESSDDAIIGKTLDGQITSWNAAAERLYGYSAAEAVGRHISFIVPPERAGEIDEILARIRAGNAVEHLETVRRRKDGTPLDISITVSPIRDDAGAVIGASTIARDITERQRTEAALKESEKRLRILADAMPQIVWAARPDGYTDYYNRRWSDYTGTSPGQAEGWGWQPVVHPDDVEDTLRCWATSVQTGRVYTNEYRIRRAADGQYRWHLARGEPVRDADGRIVRWFGTSTDIHDQKISAERARFLAVAGALLASSLDYGQTLERLAGLAVSALGDHCLIDLIDDKGRVSRVAAAHVDPGAEENVRLLRDYPPDMSKDLGVPHVLRTGTPEVFAEVSDELMSSLARDERHREILVRLDLKSFMTVPLVARERIIGALTFGSTGEPRRYGPEDLAFAGEIASRAALAIDNARLYREAREANSAKDEFLATLSHELRTPLTPIIGWTHMLQAGRLPDEDVAHGISVIENNAHSLTRLINDLLDMSSIISGKMSIERAPIDLGEVVREAVETVRPQADRLGVQIELADGDGGRPPAVVSGDRTRLVQVFWNLLANAVKFSSRGGAVRVRFGTDDGHALVRVEDEGQGIDPDFLPHVFDRFRQADGSTTRAHGGLGIGLALVKSFAEAHGGSVAAESEGARRGSRFTVRLPLMHARADRAAGDGAGERPAPGGDGQLGRVPRVLVVEDSRDTLDMLRVVFEAQGYEPVLCESADEALRLAPNLACDIIVSDIGLPKTDGYELIRLLRQFSHLRDVPAIALTGYAATRDAEEAISAGFQMHLAKPVDPTALAEAAARLLEARDTTGADADNSQRL